jgi:hypothetical protein
VGRKVTAFSDLSGAEVPEDELGRLVIRSHPSLDGPAVYLEALPDEIAALDRVNVPMVTVEWQPPGDREPKTFTLPVADFDKLAKGGHTSKLLDGAPRAGGRRSGGGEDINYATLEHAGRPHRGRISPNAVGLGSAGGAGHDHDGLVWWLGRLWPVAMAVALEREVAHLALDHPRQGAQPAQGQQVPQRLSDRLPCRPGQPPRGKTRPGWSLGASRCAGCG